MNLPVIKLVIILSVLIMILLALNLFMEMVAFIKKLVSRASAYFAKSFTLYSKGYVTKIAHKELNC